MQYVFGMAVMTESGLGVAPLARLTLEPGATTKQIEEAIKSGQWAMKPVEAPAPTPVEAPAPKGKGR